MRNDTNWPVGCVLMAAGDSRRFGRNKLDTVIGGKSMIRRALDAVPAEVLAAVCVVTQYDEIQALAREYGFSCVRNEHPDRGQSCTVRLGTEALQGSCSAILYMVADQPYLRRESVARLVALARANPERIVSAARGERRGNPCVFPGEYFPELCALTGDVGGSAVIRRHADKLLLCQVAERELRDVDVPADLSE